MARRRQPEQVGNPAEEVEAWYREELAKPAVFPWEGCRWEPVRIGPTWQTTADGHWLLPERTLGWEVLGWVGVTLQHGEGRPWRCTLEQARFLLWWFAVDDAGRWLFRDAVLQRLKGWGKDPIGALLCAVEALGPSRFDHFDRKGRPWARDEPNAWVQTAAVALKQTKNTMRLFPSLFTREAKAQYGIQVGKELIHALGDTRLIEAVTSAPSTLEGARATFVLPNETQHWLANNDGHAMAEVISRNRTKSEAGQARSLRITNAYEPSEDSVAQQDREAWELAAAGGSLSTGLLYDSLEAPPEAPLALAYDEDLSPEENAELVRTTITEVVTAIRGDSVWLDPATIVEFILDTRNPPSRSRRFWYNQITATEDAWLTPQWVDATAVDMAEDLTDEEVLFFDGGKSDDSTGVVAVRLADGHGRMLGVWQKPTGEAGKGWVVNRHDVDQRVRAILDNRNIVAFWADPSHAKDDDVTGFWDATIDGWHRDYHDRFRLWAVPTKHSVMWDMTSPERTRLFTQAAERVQSEIEEAARAAEAGQPPGFTHDGHPALARHLKNARRYPNRYGVSLWKGHRESPNKVDLAVCLVGGHLLRNELLNRGEKSPSGKKAGKVWGY